MFLARQRRTGDYYALKILKKADMISKNQVSVSSGPSGGPGRLNAHTTPTPRCAPHRPSSPSSLIAAPLIALIPHRCAPHRRRLPHRLVFYLSFSLQVVNARNERLILSSLDNPFVVKLFYSFQTEQNLYLVMEYLNGGDCATLLRNVGCLDESWAKVSVPERLCPPPCWPLNLAHPPH